MALRRIKTRAGGALSPNASNLASEAIRLPAGHRALNRQTSGATALIIAEGEVAVGTLDDNATLTAGEGVLLEAKSPYSLIAESDSLALLFSVSDRRRPPKRGAAPAQAGNRSRQLTRREDFLGLPGGGAQFVPAKDCGHFVLRIQGQGLVPAIDGRMTDVLTSFDSLQLLAV